MKLKGETKHIKCKNKRIQVFLGDNGEVHISTKRLRKHPREQIFVVSNVGYTEDTWGHIMQAYCELKIRQMDRNSEER